MSREQIVADFEQAVALCDKSDKLNRDIVIGRVAVKHMAEMLAVLRPSREPAGGDGEADRRMVDGVCNALTSAQWRDAEMESRYLDGKWIAALIRRLAAPSTPEGGLDRIDGLEFYLHENPDSEDGEPVRLVMAASMGNQVFCHRASQGDNGICRPSAAPAVVGIDAMVNRFLAWRLPDDFAPDAGISFKPITNPAWTHDYWPTGTNLLHAGQARAMFEHCLAATPAAPGGLDVVIEIEQECREAWKLATYWRRIATGCPCESEVAQQLEALANDLTDLISEEQERTLLGAAALIRHATPSAPQHGATPSWANWIATDEGGEEHYFKDEPIHWPNRRLAAHPTPASTPQEAELRKRHAIVLMNLLTQGEMDDFAAYQKDAIAAGASALLATPQPAAGVDEATSLLADLIDQESAEWEKSDQRRYVRHALGCLMQKWHAATGQRDGFIRNAEGIAIGTDEPECQHRWQPDADVEGAIYCPKCDVTRLAPKETAALAPQATEGGE